MRKDRIDIWLRPVNRFIKNETAFRELTKAYAVENGEVKRPGQEIIEMIHRAGFEPVERDTIYNRVRLKDQTDWLEGRTGDVYTFRNGKIIEFRTFADEQHALEYVGIL